MPRVALRRAGGEDAAAIWAVFDAAVPRGLDVPG